MKKNYRKKKADKEKFDVFILKDWDEYQEFETRRFNGRVQYT
ncbi:MAG: hypothetical protein ACUVRG_08915 [Ignavibacterium sp.]